MWNDPPVFVDVRSDQNCRCQVIKYYLIGKKPPDCFLRFKIDRLLFDPLSELISDQIFLIYRQKNFWIHNGFFI